MTSDPIPAKSISLKLTPITSGSTPPNLENGSFAAAITTATTGGDATQAYFDSMNQTAGYWTWMTDTTHKNEDPWAPGTDPQGHPIQMSSSGNLDLRMGVFYRDPPSGRTAHVADADDPPVVGVATIQTHNTTSGLSADISFGLGLAGLPPSIILGRELFSDLIKPVYNNLKTAVGELASKFRESSEVEDPAIDPEFEAEDTLDEASATTEVIEGELAGEGVEYLAVDWGSVGAEAAGLGVLAAIPLIVNFLGHKMVNSLVVINRTDVDFSWSLMSQEHGKASVLPDPKTNNIIPKMDYNVDSWGDKTTVKVSYEARMQFINSTDLGSIGWVLGLQPADSNPQMAIVANIPWAGSNVIWTGQSAGSADEMWLQNGQLPDGQLSKSATVGAYKTSIAINKLTGETDSAYFYGILAVIEPA